MPFKSKAQRRKFAELLMRGEISPETYEEWNRETGAAKLPERVSAAKRKRKRKSPATRKKSVKRKPRAADEKGTSKSADDGGRA